VACYFYFSRWKLGYAIPFITGTDHALMSPRTGLSALSSTRLHALSSARLHALSSARLHALSSAGLSALSSTSLHALSSARLSALSSTSLHALSSARLHALSSARLLHAFSTRSATSRRSKHGFFHNTCKTRRQIFILLYLTYGCYCVPDILLFAFGVLFPKIGVGQLLLKHS